MDINYANEVRTVVAWIKIVRIVLCDKFGSFGFNKETFDVWPRGSSVGLLHRIIYLEFKSVFG